MHKGLCLACFQIPIALALASQDMRTLAEQHREIRRDLSDIQDEYHQHEVRAEEMVQGLREQNDKNATAFLAMMQNVQKAQAEFLPAVREVATELKSLNSNLKNQNDKFDQYLRYVVYVIVSFAGGTFGLRQTKQGARILGDRRQKSRGEESNG